MFSRRCRLARMSNYFFANLLFLMFYWSSVAIGQEMLRLPDDECTKTAVIRASDWLTKHVKTGELHREGREYSISVIAWKDPTLNPELPKQLAGYCLSFKYRASDDWVTYFESSRQRSVLESARQNPAIE